MDLCFAGLLVYADDLVLRRLVQIQQETCSKYAMNLVNDIRLSSLLLSPNVYCVYLLIDNAVCLMPQLLSSILVAT